MTETKRKKCVKCKQVKEASDFFKQSDSSDGLAYYCKLCQKKYSKQYYQNPDNKKKIIDRANTYYSVHRKEILARLRESNAQSVMEDR